MKKNESTLLSGTFKVLENKVLLLFFISGDIDDLCFWPVHEFDRNHLQEKPLFHEAGFLSFKVKKQHPMKFLRGYKILKEKLC